MLSPAEKKNCHGSVGMALSSTLLSLVTAGVLTAALGPSLTAAGDRPAKPYDIPVPLEEMLTGGH
jgi:hypothetical protein